jgi:hypothetical protein
MAVRPKIDFTLREQQCDPSYSIRPRSVFLIEHEPNRIGFDDSIKPEEWERNNWTMVLAIPWYRSMQRCISADAERHRLDLPIEPKPRS